MSYEPDLQLKLWIQDEINRRVKTSVERLVGRIDHNKRGTYERLDVVKKALEGINSVNDEILNIMINHIGENNKKLKKLSRENEELKAELEALRNKEN